MRARCIMYRTQMVATTWNHNSLGWRARAALNRCTLRKPYLLLPGDNEEGLVRVFEDALSLIHPGEVLLLGNDRVNVRDNLLTFLGRQERDVASSSMRRHLERNFHTPDHVEHAQRHHL